MNFLIFINSIKIFLIGYFKLYLKNYILNNVDKYYIGELILNNVVK